MNNFLDLLDTDPKILIRLQLTPICDNGAPQLVVTINGTRLHSGPVDAVTNITKTIGLRDNVIVELVLKEKKYHESLETAVIINSIQIDDFEFVPNYTDGDSNCIYYDNDHNIIAVTNYLGFNGVWQLRIDEPFYRWRHKNSGQGMLLEPVNFLHTKQQL
jgi:hypothetical protein